MAAARFTAGRFGLPALTRNSTRAETGSAGEAIAAHTLAEKGYRILQRNYRCRGGEIDIVARDAETLVFVEVKTRKAHSDEPPEAALTRRKKQRLISAARHFMRTYKLHDSLFRFDLIGIEYDNKGDPEINHWENCINYSRAKRRNY